MSRSFTLYITSEIFLSLGIGIALYAQPFLYKSVGLNDATIGLLFAVNAMVSGVAALLLGSVADRVGASRVVKFATLLLSASYLFTGLGHDTSVWLVTACVSGLGGALLMSTENVVLSTLAKGHEMATALSRFLAMYTFVMGAGAVIAGPISAHFGYRTAMLTGACIALCAPVIRFFVRADDVRSPRLFKLPSKRLAAMSVYAGIFGVALGLFNPFATLVLQGKFGLHATTIALISAVSTFMMSLGAFTVKPLLRRLKHDRTLLISFVFAIGFTVCMAATGNVFFFAGLYLSRTLVTSVPGSIVDAMFLNLTDASEYAQMFGVRVFGNSVGTAAGSYCGGLLLAAQAGSQMFIASACVMVVAYLYLLLLLSRTRRAAYRGAPASPVNLPQ